MSKDEVIDLFGDPEERELDKWSDDSDSETWRFQCKGIELRFDSDDQYLLSTITIENKNAILFGKSPIGKSEEELLECYPDVVLDEDFEEAGKDYIIHEEEVSFWVSEGKVINITLFPQFDESGTTIIWPRKNN